MKAAITTEGGGFECVTLPDPTPTSDQVVLSVSACGICGSDLKAHAFMAPGTVMGHEMCGEVVALGKDARCCREGDHIAVLPVVSCGVCASCLSGNVAHCPSVRFIGMGSDSGGFAEYAAVPARHAFRLSPEYSNALGALVEPFAVGLHGAAAAEVGPGDKVLVIGGGGVGLTVVAWARALGAERVTVADPLAARRAVAATMGATDELANAAEADYGGYDAVIECVGRPDLLDSCINAARARGRIVIAGACDSAMQLTPITAMLKEVSIRFTVAYAPGEFQKVIDAFATGLIDPRRMAGPSVGLDHLGDAFNWVRSGGTQGRVLVRPKF